MSNEIVIQEGTEQNVSEHRVKVAEATWKMHPSFHEPYQCALFSIVNLATGEQRDEQIFMGSSLLLGIDYYSVSHVSPGSDGSSRKAIPGSVTLRKRE